MHTDKFKELKAQGENLTVFILSRINPDKQSALHELFKEEEPNSIRELCDSLRAYALNLSLNYTNFPFSSTSQADELARVITQFDQLAFDFQNKHSEGNGESTTLTKDLLNLAKYFVEDDKHLVIDNYYNYMLHPNKEKLAEPIRAKL